ncbi:hypothetical protein C8P68_104296 [Mucilaginibacter yixingensis]|uniref:Uncharacterized protein n=1 Tax=Mucilaginibacter yixingensis TaxID=1295612 RepID=A0A2T5J9R4_9SPHI|nr:hypothetical protein [Mucilaginibacter yixingensis]PTQ96806.1 hypothetical protein C8P68_104296 [Mucilaginibacter yixingensis]
MQVNSTTSNNTLSLYAATNAGGIALLVGYGVPVLQYLTEGARKASNNISLKQFRFFLSDI